METGRQNVQNMMDSIGNQRQPAFALAGDGNVNLPKSNVSTKIDDFADRIQQISVDHKQKIAAFEGRGGGRSIPTPVNNMQEFFETDFGEQLKSSVRKTKKRYDGQTIYEVVDKSIPGLKKGDQIYLDGMHKDHLEVFKSNGEFKKVINIDGTINKMKTKLGAGRRLNK
jgi:hemagglutinin/hemolysin family protein